MNTLQRYFGVKKVSLEHRLTIKRDGRKTGAAPFYAQREGREYVTLVLLSSPRFPLPCL